MSEDDRLLPKIYLRPGELVVVEEPMLVITVLGSCISIVLFSPRVKMGAICHATMPSGRENNPSKYADQSVHYLVEEFQRRGIKRRETVVKVFGGADMFSIKEPGDRERSIGAQNVRVALETLSRAGYEPAVTDVGGELGRKLIFRPHTGEVFRKWVKKEQLVF